MLICNCQLQQIISKIIQCFDGEYQFVDYENVAKFTKVQYDEHKVY